MKKIKAIDFKEFERKIHVRQRAVANFIKERRTVKLLHVLRHYSALVVVISSALLVTATNVAAGKGNSGFLFGYWDNGESDSTVNTVKINGQLSRKNDLALVPLSKAVNSVDPQYKEEDVPQVFSQGQSILASAQSSNAIKDPEEDGGVKMYVVQQGDTISSIAAKNKISVNTILWANDIDNVDSIRPGDTLFILPVSGIQYVVKKGDNIDAVAAKYKSDREKIISFNDLPADGDLEEGKTIVIPDGQGETASRPDTPSTSPSSSPQQGIERRQYANATGGAPQVSGFKTPEEDGKRGGGHKFPYGYCTWYVAQKRYVPWGGNAGTWLYRAKAMGYKTGKTPRPGAIMVTTENRYYGHVALVEKVNGDSITVSEMNFVGWGKVSRRTLSASSRAIKGFIY